MSNSEHRKVGHKTKTKLNLVLRSMELTGVKLGRFIRENGLYKTDLERWRQQMQLGLEKETRVTRATRSHFTGKIKQLKKKLKSTERELKEAKIIIEAQKKIQKILEEEEKSTQKRRGKKSSS